MEYRSENEFSTEESFFLPGVEYLQYLIARTEAATSGHEPSEDEWEQLWSLTLEILRLTQTYLFTRGTVSAPPSEIDALRFLIDGMRLGVRVHSHPFFLADHWRDALVSYDKWIRELYGIGAEELITALRQIEDYQKTGIFDRYGEAIAATESLTERLREKGYAVDPGAPDEEVERTRQALASPEFIEHNRAAEEKTRLALTPAAFDITDVTSLPESVLSALSVRPGERVLRDPTLEQHDDISPLSTSVFHFKPFLQVGERFYFFYHSGFEDRIAEIIEAELLNRRSSETASMAKKYSDHFENVARDLLAGIVRPDIALQQLYYPNPDQPGDLTELDLLLAVDDILFLVEVKSGGMSAAASRGAPKSLASDLSDLISAGQRQAERAERYIRSDAEVSFFNETGKTIVHRVRAADYRRVFRVVVTRENLGWVGAQIAVLSILDPGLSKSHPWHVSIDDLRMIADLFEGKDIEFAHFLEQRLRASSETRLSQHDEIEHVALYQRLNRYHDLRIRGAHRMSFDPSYMRDIDHYFGKKYAGEQVPAPEQYVPAILKRLLEALRSSRLHGRFEVGSILLSMGQDGRTEIERSLAELERRRAAGGQPSLHLPFPEDALGLSLTQAADANLDEERVRCAARMQQGGHARWLLVQLENQSSYIVKRIHVITPNTISEAELTRGLEQLTGQAATTAAARKIRRNERCPCGSGKKYKRCHGR